MTIRRIGLVSCSKAKLTRPAAARDLYSVSALFRGQRTYAERECDDWFILSAKHGLVDPDEVLDPYEQTLATASASERQLWSADVLGALERKLGSLEGVTFDCLAGSLYLDNGLVAGILQRGGHVNRPTLGMRMGEQLAYFAKINAGGVVSEPGLALPPRPDLVMTPRVENARVDLVTRAAVVEALLAFGRTLDSDTLVALGPDPESDQLIRDDPFAFLLGVVFDQGIRFERAWRAPYDLQQRLGTIDPAYLASHPSEVRAAVTAPPALHRYVNNMPAWIVAAAQRVLTNYDGDAESIWNDHPTAEQLRGRFEAFKGIGQKKAAMAVEILERQRGVAITHMEGSDIAYDVHVRRVFLRTGLASVDDLAHMVSAARELHPARPGELDYPAWWIGHEWCGPGAPACADCPLARACPKSIEAAAGVR
jgi:uncharacterized HhH-GPD family protein